ncbi:MAG: aminotransferase class V-fold PLP-dependent enzyme [Ilumatobacteraceae bacterium]
MDVDAILAEATRLDGDDPLASQRDRFVIPDPDLAYLDGNSLGMTPRTTVHRIHEVMNDEWADGLIRSWAHWLDMPLTAGDELAPLIGANDGEVVVHDSTTINLHQLLHAAVALRPGSTHIAVDPGEFPTDRYAVAAVAAQHGLSVRNPSPGTSLDETDLNGCAAVVRSLVDYRSAAVADLIGFTEHAERAGTLVIWDLSHAVGAIEVDLPAASVDMAVGCTYKFLNGGPGAPGFSFVRAGLVDEVDHPIRGWFGQDDQFDMDADWRPKPGVGRLMIGTPGILSLEAARCGIAISAEVGAPALAGKSRALTTFALDLVDRLGLLSDTDRDPHRRGAHVAVRHPDAEAINTALATSHNVVADYRRPDVVRLGCSPLTTRFVDVARAIVALRLEIDQRA